MSVDDIFENSPKIVNINITCQTGSSLTLNNHITIASSDLHSEEITEYIDR